MNKTLYLISNAHLDPVWQWEWDEGAAAAVSTFRTAAKFCRERDGYIFCHNEAVLYEWVEEYEPALFEEIKKLVDEGKWIIIGGWYIQPDCNMPSGETFIRHATYGRRYFYEKFGVVPTVANSFDAFGHSRGLVQILAKCGYKYYLHCRPDDGHLRMPDRYKWIGYDGSVIIGERQQNGYGTGLGTADLKARGILAGMPDNSSAFCLWGVGDHGGGASKLDLDKLDALMTEAAQNGDTVKHASPDEYFATVDKDSLPLWDKDINPWAVGCYTSMARLKTAYRRLEDMLYETEKMCMHSRFAVAYPKDALLQAEKTLLFATFHDYLPGSSVEPVEKAGLDQLGGAYDSLTKLRAASVFAMCSGQKAAAPDEIPVIVYNPHPYPVKDVFSCEFMLWDQGWADTVKYPHLFTEDGTEVPCQPEKELSNIPIDWRKRISFYAEAAPCSVTRFNCKFEDVKKKPTEQLPVKDGCLVFDNGVMHAEVSLETGLLRSYRTGGRELLHDAFRLDVFADKADAWGMTVTSYPDFLYSFRLADAKETGAFSGLAPAELPPVRVIENGGVRVVVEAVFSGPVGSTALVKYAFNRSTADVDVSVRLQMNEKLRMVKLALPMHGLISVTGETPYGRERLRDNGDETVSQRYRYMASENGGVLICGRSTYGSSVSGGEYRISLLHTVPFTSHPLGDRRVMPEDRWMAFMDMDTQTFEFRLTGGEGLLDRAARLSQQYCEAPYCMSFFPSGNGVRPAQSMLLEDDDCVVMSAYKESVNGEGDVIRLFNPTDTERTVTLRLGGSRFVITIPPHAVETYLYDGALSKIRADEADTYVEGVMK